MVSKKLARRNHRGGTTKKESVTNKPTGVIKKTESKGKRAFITVKAHGLRRRRISRKKIVENVGKKVILKKKKMKGGVYYVPNDYLENKILFGEAGDLLFKYYNDIITPSLPDGETLSFVGLITKTLSQDDKSITIDYSNLNNVKIRLYRFGKEDTFLINTNWGDFNWIYLNLLTVLDGNEAGGVVPVKPLEKYKIHMIDITIHNFDFPSCYMPCTSPNSDFKTKAECAPAPNKKCKDNFPWEINDCNGDTCHWFSLAESKQSSFTINQKYTPIPISYIRDMINEADKPGDSYVDKVGDSMEKGGVDRWYIELLEKIIGTYMPIGDYVPTVPRPPAKIGPGALAGPAAQPDLPGPVTEDSLKPGLFKWLQTQPMYEEKSGELLVDFNRYSVPGYFIITGGDVNNLFIHVNTQGKCEIIEGGKKAIPGKDKVVNYPLQRKINSNIKQTIKADNGDNDLDWSTKFLIKSFIATLSDTPTGLYGEAGKARPFLKTDSASEEKLEEALKIYDNPTPVSGESDEEAKKKAAEALSKALNIEAETMARVVVEYNMFDGEEIEGLFDVGIPDGIPKDPVEFILLDEERLTDIEDTIKKKILDKIKELKELTFSSSDENSKYKWVDPGSTYESLSIYRQDVLDRRREEADEDLAEVPGTPLERRALQKKKQQIDAQKACELEIKKLDGGRRTRKNYRGGSLEKATQRKSKGIIKRKPIKNKSDATLQVMKNSLKSIERQTSATAQGLKKRKRKGSRK
jgi:hypothetical protein